MVEAVGGSADCAFEREGNLWHSRRQTVFSCTVVGNRSGPARAQIGPLVDEILQDGRVTHHIGSGWFAVDGGTALTPRAPFCPRGVLSKKARVDFDVALVLPM